MRIVLKWGSLLVEIIDDGRSGSADHNALQYPIVVVLHVYITVDYHVLRPLVVTVVVMVPLPSALVVSSAAISSPVASTII